MKPKVVNKLEAVISQGEELDRLLIIKTGEIVSEVEGGPENDSGECDALSPPSHVNQLGHETWVGDVALLGVREPSPHTLRTTKDTLLLSIDDVTLWTELESFPRERKRFADHRDALAKLQDPPEGDHVDLVSLSCFYGFNRPFVESLDDVTERRLVLPETRVVREGEEADCLILVETGVLALEIQDQQIREVADGNYVGETVLIGSGRKCKWSAHTRTHCALRVLHQTALNQVLLQFPEEKARLKAMFDKHSVARRGNDLQSLKNVHVFEDVSSKFLSTLHNLLEERLYWPGQVIIEEGSESTSLFIIHSGQVIVQAGGIEISRLSEGAVFRELAVLGVERRAPRGLVAGNEVVFCSVLHRSVLRSVFQDFPDERAKLDGVAHDDFEIRSVDQWPVFHGMTAALLERLEARIDRRVFLKGQCLADVPAGGHWPGVISLVRGQAIVSLGDHDVHVLGSGGIYGEICALGVPVARRERLQQSKSAMSKSSHVRFFSQL
jgi:CRP-like cAMP-binding protein